VFCPFHPSPLFSLLCWVPPTNHFKPFCLSYLLCNVQLSPFVLFIFFSSRIIFDKCRKEGRCLITTSTKLMLRQNCPPGSYLINPKSLGQPEVTLVHLLLSHGVILEPSKFLNRCVVCNGSIESVEDEQAKRDIFVAHQAPEILQTSGEVMTVYQCNRCGQGYWWCDRPTSSASRVMNQATKLLELCIIGGVPVNTKNMAMFAHINVERLQNFKARAADKEGINKNNKNNNNGAAGEDDDEVDGELKVKVSTLSEQRLAVIDWLQQTELKNPFGALTSAYQRPKVKEGQHQHSGSLSSSSPPSISSSPDEDLPFTNVTSDFVGHLDYILYNPNDMIVKERLYVPTSFEELNDLGIRNGHLLPSTVWPSDHLAIGARFSLCPVDASAIHTRPSTINGPTTDLSDSVVPANAMVLDSTARNRGGTSEDTKEGPILFCSPVGVGALAPPPPLPSTTGHTSNSDSVMPAPARVGDSSASHQGRASEDAKDAPILICSPMGVGASAPPPAPPRTEQTVTSHLDRCACGCVPPIKSLFEMAELRKQYRLKKKQEEEQRKD
jgi:uncharacterized protein with PIN domain